MATYLILNLVFITLACLFAGVKARRPRKALLVTLVVLFVLTAVFDNLIVGLSIVDYDPEKILGIHIGVAPVEDFMYALLAVILVPAIWHKLEKRHV